MIKQLQLGKHIETSVKEWIHNTCVPQLFVYTHA